MKLKLSFTTRAEAEPDAAEVTRWFMPIGREGCALTPEQAEQMLANGNMTLCHQCSQPERLVYHDAG